jgi:hypothetical protein
MLLQKPLSLPERIQKILGKLRSEILRKRRTLFGIPTVFCCGFLCHDKKGVLSSAWQIIQKQA